MPSEVGILAGEERVAFDAPRPFLAIVFALVLGFLFAFVFAGRVRGIGVVLAPASAAVPIVIVVVAGTELFCVLGNASHCATCGTVDSGLVNVFAARRAEELPLGAMAETNTDAADVDVGVSGVWVVEKPDGTEVALIPLARQFVPVRISELRRSPVVTRAPLVPNMGVIILASVASAHAELALAYHRASNARARRQGDRPVRRFSQVCRVADPAKHAIGIRVTTIRAYTE